MRGLENCLSRLCLLLCLFSTGYMTYLQFKYYLNNEDLSSILYREFNNEEKDEYPVFSVCHSGAQGQLFVMISAEVVSTGQNIQIKKTLRVISFSI